MGALAEAIARQDAATQAAPSDATEALLDGLNRTELRALLPLYEESHAKLGKALVNLKARMRSGK